MNYSSLSELKLSDLHLMVELSETHSLREVARRHSLNPSQLSKSIRRIEEKVGLSLLSRSPQKMTFTLEGMQFLKIAREILKLSPALASGKLENPPRTYVIASYSFINQYLLAECLGKITKEDDKTKFQLIEMSNKDQVMAGINGVFEISLHTKFLNWPKTWISKKVGYTKSGLYGRKGHPLGAKSDSEEVLKYKFVVPLRVSKSGIQNGDDDCPINIQDRIPGNGCMTGATALSFIKNNNQISYLPQIVAKAAIAKGEIMEIHVADWKESKEPIYLVARGDAVPQKLFNLLHKELSLLLNG